MKTRYFLPILLLWCSAHKTFAAVPNISSLKGTYSAQLAVPHLDIWAVGVSCGLTTIINGGTFVSNEVSLGTITFDGKGNFTASFTVYNHFDQQASDNSVICNSDGTYTIGNPVFDIPFQQTFTGTYTVQSDGTGALLANNGLGGLIFILGNSNSKGIRQSILFHVADTHAGVGTAVLQ